MRTEDFEWKYSPMALLRWSPMLWIRATKHDYYRINANVLLMLHANNCIVMHLLESKLVKIFQYNVNIDYKINANVLPMLWETSCPLQMHRRNVIIGISLLEERVAKRFLVRRKLYEIINTLAEDFSLSMEWASVKLRSFVNKGTPVLTGNQQSELN